MGGGNGQKSAMKRAKNQEKLAKANNCGSQLKGNLASQTYKCAVCCSTFVCTTTEAKLREHSDNKHPNKDFYECYPFMQKPE